MKRLIFLLVLLLFPVCSLADTIFKDKTFSEYNSIVYEPFNFFEAYHNSQKYRGTFVAFEGRAATSYNVNEETSVLYVNPSRTEDNSIMLIVNDSPDFLDRFFVGDTVLVKGIASGDTTELEMSYKSPIVLPISIEIVSPGPFSPDYSPKYETIGYVKKGVNLRSAPDSSSKKVGYLKQGELVCITKLNFSKGWHQISYGGLICYVSSKYIDI